MVKTYGKKLKAFVLNNFSTTEREKNRRRLICHGDPAMTAWKCTPPVGSSSSESAKRTVTEDKDKRRATTKVAGGMKYLGATQPGADRGGSLPPPQTYRNTHVNLKS
jgi:hypothetical protein